MQSQADQSAESRRSIMVVIAASAAVLALSFGIRTTFGGVLEPLSRDFGWPREIFSLSLAIQNLVWGLAQPMFGAIADKYGDRKALYLGFFCYLAGMILSAVGMTPMAQHLGAGVLVGAGIAGTAFGLVLAVVGRASPPEKRSQNLGLVSALGSSGMVVMPLAAAWLTDAYGWQSMLWVMTILVLPIALLIPFMKVPAPAPKTGAPGAEISPAEAEIGIAKMTGIAFRNQSFVLLVLGFFVCGFQVAFVAVHFPAFVAERCGDPALGLQALGVVGFMNIVGTFAAGHLGARLPKNYVLSAIYALRSVVVLIFISIPTTPLTVMLFAVALGPLWLSTVPLTSGLVAGMFGLRYMGTLYGFVFLSHQLGSFTGVYMGGVLYDLYGSYDAIWWLSIALGVFSAIVHLPVREKPDQAAVPA